MEEFMPYEVLAERWKSKLSLESLLRIVNNKALIAYKLFKTIDKENEELTNDSIINMIPITKIIHIYHDEYNDVCIADSKNIPLIAKDLIDQENGNRYNITIYFEKKSVVELENKYPKIRPEVAIPLAEKKS